MHRWNLHASIVFLFTENPSMQASITAWIMHRSRVIVLAPISVREVAYPQPVPKGSIGYRFEFRCLDLVRVERLQCRFFSFRADDAMLSEQVADGAQVPREFRDQGCSSGAPLMIAVQSFEIISCDNPRTAGGSHGWKAPMYSPL
jgi:hypothetical protein